MRITSNQRDERQSLIDAYLAARADADRAQDHLRDAQAALLEYMESREQKSTSYDDGDFLHKITYVCNTRVSVDEKGLRKALTAKVFDKYTDKVLNKKRMEEAMDTGEIDPVVVSKFVTTTQTVPFVKYTMTKKEAL